MATEFLFREASHQDPHTLADLMNEVEITLVLLTISHHLHLLHIRLFDTLLTHFPTVVTLTIELTAGTQLWRHRHDRSHADMLYGGRA